VPVFGPVAAGRTYAGALDQIGLGLAEAKGNYKKTMQLIARKASSSRRASRRSGGR
jgi:hypothetical protein